MASVARDLEGVAVQPAELDANLWTLNCSNGTIDLKGGVLLPHRREDLNTKMAPVRFDPNAEALLWLAFLDRIFGGDRAMIRFVQQSLGLCLTGDVTEEYLWIFHGEGNNGKNVLLDTVTALMGEYAAQAPPDLLTASKHGEHPTEIADLCGRRLVIASETEESATLRLQLIKRLTGDARLKARFMHRDFFEFGRTHKLVLLTNNLPVVTEGGEAAWRRLRVVPFRVIIPAAERDPKLLAKLRVEWPGILAWVVRGCLDWQTNGLVVPTVVTEATSAYRGDSDHVGRFLSDCCTLADGVWATSLALQQRYSAWCGEQGERPLTGKALGVQLRKHGCRAEKSAGQRGWVGVEVNL
jgi:putative DNA primase/helicase